MKILALEPYYGGSHKAFLDALAMRSRHDWTLLTLPPHKWKWRMRHAAITFAEQVAERANRGEAWDLMFASDMLNLAEFRGLAAPSVARLPAVAYFHENQLTYPVRDPYERDLHFGMTNFVSVLAADAVWFNSAFHRDAFYDELEFVISHMPDHQPMAAVASLKQDATVMPPGVDRFSPCGPRRAGPLRILWSARWEHDKDPETFFAAMSQLKARGVPFRLSVLGQSFRESPVDFDTARNEFREFIDQWGYLATREDYESALLDADVVVSTAQHEFFGIAVVEAIAAGAYPLLPLRLSYPELLSCPELLEKESVGGADSFFYGDDDGALADALAELAGRLQATGGIWQGDPNSARRRVARFTWDELISRYDDALDGVAELDERRHGRQ